MHLPGSNFFDEFIILQAQNVEPSMYHSLIKYMGKNFHPHRDRKHRHHHLFFLGKLAISRSRIIL